mgnify:CR=1 FL=1
MSIEMIVYTVIASAVILTVAGLFIWSAAENSGRRKERERIRRSRRGGSAMPY